MHFLPNQDMIKNVQAESVLDTIYAGIFKIKI